jgi:hypothetical protein
VRCSSKVGEFSKASSITRAFIEFNKTSSVLLELLLRVQQNQQCPAQAFIASTALLELTVFNKASSALLELSLSLTRSTPTGVAEFTIGNIANEFTQQVYSFLR